jgi:ubiquinone/menaquinone biosynthesis C-methylase UbiE
MSTPLRPRKSESPSTYFVQDRKSEKELTRLTIQDRMLTAGMSGVLPEQLDPTVFRHILDVGCGTGGWLIEAAQACPEMSLVGIDISQRMIKYAYAQAEAHHVHDRIEFHIMDALQTLDFPAASFDLVNLRLGVSFLRTWDWPKVLGELLRITKPGGVIRITDSEICHQSNSPALTRLWEVLLCAFFRAGRLFTQETAGLTSQLVRLLSQCGCERVHTRACQVEYRAGTAEGEAFCEDIMLAFQTIRPFIQKWGCAIKDYESVYRQAVDEMYQPDFLAVGSLLTAWGNRPRQ